MNSVRATGTSTNIKRLAIALAIVAACQLTGGYAITKEKSQPTIGGSFKILVNPGDEAKALAYYKDVVTVDTGFETKDRPTLDSLIRFFGYSSLTGEELESKDSDVIMSTISGQDVLVSRFFAPKITDVSGLVTPRAFGWRKLVRLRAQADSAAAKGGLQSMFLLFNMFSAELKSSPFLNSDGSVNHSVNNQVILVRASGSTLKQPIYFMTFGAYNSKEESERGRLITYLDATFDAADPNLVKQDAKGKKAPGVDRYYVPLACAACHGGVARPKLNYLDTDHWFDRVEKGDDFEAVSAQPIVFDAGTNDPAENKFKAAFEVLRSLNREILEQNIDSDKDRKSFQQVAAKSWLSRHETTFGQVPLLDRSIKASGDITWNAKDEVDAQLLPLLNRYCFRCHSSLRYHVYDKQAVVDRASGMIDRINDNPTGEREYFMPQDRVFSDPDRATMLKLLELVK